MNAQEIVGKLAGAETRAEGREVLEGLTRKQLGEVAQAAGKGFLRGTKADMVLGLVEGTVGARADAAAIRTGVRMGRQHWSRQG
jgi:hypothetical protein